MKRNLIITIILALFAVSCTHQERTDKPIITVSLAPQKYFLEQLLGDMAEINVLVPSGNNPEHYDPAPRDITKLQSSIAYFAIGTLPFEQQWIEILPESVQVINIARQMPHDMIFSHDEAHSHVHIYGDPHYWTSISGAKAMLEVMLDALQELFPEEQEQLRENYLSCLEHSINDVERLARETFQGQDSIAFVIYHPSLSLFASEWGLQQLVIEENGLEPTPRHLVRLIEEARSSDTRVVLIQEEFDQKNAESIASELGLETYAIQPLAEDWTAEMTRLIEAFK